MLTDLIKAYQLLMAGKADMSWLEFSVMTMFIVKDILIVITICFTVVYIVMKWRQR